MALILLCVCPYRGPDQLPSSHLFPLSLSRSGALLPLPPESPQERPCGRLKGQEGPRETGGQDAAGVSTTKGSTGAGKGAGSENEDHWVQQRDGIFQP